MKKITSSDLVSHLNRFRNALSLVRNDNSTLSFWRSLFGDWRIHPCRNKKDSSSKRKASLSEWQCDSSSKQKLLCRNDNSTRCHSKGAFWRLKNLFMIKTMRFLVEAKNFSVGMTIQPDVILKELFSDWRIYSWLKQWDFSSKRKASLSEWQDDFVILKEPFGDWRISPCRKREDSSSKQKTSLSEWQWWIGGWVTRFCSGVYRSHV